MLHGYQFSLSNRVYFPSIAFQPTSFMMSKMCGLSSFGRYFHGKGGEDLTPTTRVSPVDDCAEEDTPKSNSEANTGKKRMIGV